MKPRLKELYQNQIIPDLQTRFGYKNIMEVPRLEKVVLNMRVGEATQNPKALDGAINDLTVIAGQKPVVARARK